MIKQLPYQQKVVTRQPIVATNVVKGNEVRVKDGLCEVRSIFQRVDNAFKKRKEENEVLAIAVADLENHLTYLENQTQDQITATTALNLALASTQKNVNDVSSAVQDVSAKALEELNERLLQLSAAAEQAEASVGAMRSNLGCLGVIQSDAEGEARALLAEIEEYLGGAAEQTRTIAELETVTAQKEAGLKDARERLADQKLQEQQLQRSIAESQSALPAVQSRFEGLRAELEETRRAQISCAQSAEELKQQRVSLECAAEARRTAFTIQSALREEEITALSARYADACALRNARYQVLQSMQKQHSELESQLAQRRQSVRALQEVQLVRAQQLEDSKEEAQRLHEKRDAAVVEHKVAQKASTKAQQLNEQQYELTCLRMTQLRELQQQQCSLTQDLHSARWKLSVTVNQLRGKVQDQQATTAHAQTQAQLQRVEAEKSSTEAQRLREQRQSANDAVDKEKTLLLDLDVEATALTTKREEQTRNAERRTALNEALAAREAELLQLRESNAAQIQANEAAVQKLAAVKTAVADAKAKLKSLKKAGANTADTAPLSEDLAAKLQAEVDKDVQEMRGALDAQHAAEVAEINQCLEKLAAGFPNPAAADGELQAKEAAVASAKQDLTNLKQELADKQRAEGEKEDQRRTEQQRLLDEARGQKEREDELAREEARMDVQVAEHGAGLDEFFLFERVESDSPHTHTVRERCVQVLSCGMTAEAAVDVSAAVVGEDAASPTERQRKPQLPAPSSGPSRWELSEPATSLPPFISAPAPYENVGASMLHAESENPPPLPPAASDTVASHSSQSQQSQRRGKKKKRRNRLGRTPPSSAASSLDLLKPQPALSRPFPVMPTAPGSRLAAPSGASTGPRGGPKLTSDRVRTELQSRNQSQRQQPELPRQHPSQQAHRAAGELRHASRAPPSHGAAMAKPAGTTMGPPRMQPSASAASRKSFAFPAMQQQRQKTGHGGSSGMHKAPSPGDWFAEDAPF